MGPGPGRAGPREARLLEEDHFPLLDEVGRVHAIEVDSGRHVPAQIVGTIPDDRLPARFHHPVDKLPDERPRHAVDGQLHLASRRGDIVRDPRARVERVREVAPERVARRETVLNAGARALEVGLDVERIGPGSVAHGTVEPVRVRT